jgi:hypothetical protein
VPECPTNAIHELNFPPRKPKPEKEAPAKKEAPKDTVEKPAANNDTGSESDEAKEAN